LGRAARRSLFPSTLSRSRRWTARLAARHHRDLLSRERINVTAANCAARKQRDAETFTLEVKSLGALARALALVRDVARGLSCGGRR
jgi:hypothetical protein